MTSSSGEDYLKAWEKSLKSGKRFSYDSFGNKKADPQGKATPAPKDGPNVAGTAQPDAKTAPGVWTKGDILSFGDGSVGIFKAKAPKKEYHVVYFLEANGDLKAQGILLARYQVEKIGQIPLETFDAYKLTQRWSRDHIVFHLESWDLVGLLPPAVDYVARHSPAIGNVAAHRGGEGGVPDEHAHDLSASDMDSMAGGDDSDASDSISSMQAGEKTEAPRKDEEGLCIGRRFTIKFGANDWEAVYWGKDELGDLVVHDTNKVWTMMHLKMERFEDSLVLGERLPTKEILEIQSQLELEM